MKISLLKVAFISLFLIFSFASLPSFAHADNLSQPDTCLEGQSGPSTGNAFTDSLTCPPQFARLQLLGLRLFGVVNVIIGVIMLFSIIKAGFLFVTSTGVPEKVANASKSLRWAIIGFIGVSLAYVVLVFMGTLLLSSDTNKLSFIDSNKLIFDFTQYFGTKKT